MKRFIDLYCSNLEKHQIISQEQTEVCAYGLELLLSGLINIFILVLCSFILHEEKYIFFYFLGFIPMRLFAGGYHADNHLNCCIVFAGIYMISLFVKRFIIPVSMMLFIVIEGLLVFCLSPVESPNKHLTDRRRKISRCRSIGILLCNFAICVIYLWFQTNNTYIAYYLLSGFLASLTMIAGKIKLCIVTQRKVNE